MLFSEVNILGEFFKKGNKQIGSAPGTLVHIGEHYTDKVKITMIEYSEDYYNEIEANTVEDCFEMAKSNTIKWVNVDGINDISIIEKIGIRLNLHPLLLEDILNTGQRSKMDDYEDNLFIVLKMIYYNEKENLIKSEQVSIVVKDNYLISFQEFSGDVFQNIRDRLKGGRRNIRKTGSDYLAYALMDAIVDSYFLILEKMGNKMDDIEERMMDNPSRDVLQEIYNIKRQMLFLRNSLWPLREVIGTMSRCESNIIKDTTGIYLRDVYDHCIQVIDTIETYQDIMSNMLDTYLSSISNKTNDVMKVLTIFSTIFIPLTFLAGIYGMNFKYIPELQWNYGYPIFWIVSIIIIIVMLCLFKKRKWL